VFAAASAAASAFRPAALAAAFVFVAARSAAASALAAAIFVLAAASLAADAVAAAAWSAATADSLCVLAEQAPSAKAKPVTIRITAVRMASLLV
jgi:hypothetical protein